MPGFSKRIRELFAESQNKEHFERANDIEFAVRGSCTRRASWSDCDNKMSDRQDAAFLPRAALPIAQHAVIGDRRTGAMVAADGTINWFCAPDFDAPSLFGSLLDAQNGGYCRLGPANAALGRQRYEADSMVLVTGWEALGIQIADVMASPQDQRDVETRDERTIIRRLCVSQSAEVLFGLRVRRGADPPDRILASPDGMTHEFVFPQGTLQVWLSFPLSSHKGGLSALLTLPAGAEHWIVIGWNRRPSKWSADKARAAFGEAQRYWQQWASELQLTATNSRAALLRRSALTVQLLGHADHNCPVAALTSSLPERVGGDRNYDYRYCWIRDGSLSLALIARSGKPHEVQRFLRWLCARKPGIHMPLQVCYRVNGDPHIDELILAHVPGYRDSSPVQVGNRAARQRQQGSFGFLADCARIYVDVGGEWCEQFSDLLQRIADHICEHWDETDSGVWEFQQERDFVASRVMSWVVLESALHIGADTEQAATLARWQDQAQAIYAQVMDKGWSESKGAFRQHYDSDALDASALLIPLMGFLPIDHPRVESTVAALERELMVHGLLHRFDPQATLGEDQLPMGEFEGAFLPCVFWHAQVLAKAGRCEEADRILRRCEAIGGEVGLFAEEVDARHDSFLGNTPLLFSHVEYVRAVLALESARCGP
jgi:GH15 family glucan-1,4-alpha-glucosidase